MCEVIDDELMGKNKIRYPNTRHRILKCNTNSGISETFSFGFRNPGLWNPEFSSRNPESRIQAPLTRNPESSAWNLESKTVLVHFRCRELSNLHSWPLFLSKAVTPLKIPKYGALKPTTTSNTAETWQLNLICYKFDCLTYAPIHLLISH